MWRASRRGGLLQRREGKIRGLGLSYYVERTAAGMSDYARIALDGENGMVHVWTGQQTNGQGHETAWTQFLANRLGLDVEKIKVHLGDSDVLPGGAGTGRIEGDLSCHGRHRRRIRTS